MTMVERIGMRAVGGPMHVHDAHDLCIIDERHPDVDRTHQPWALGDPHAHQPWAPCDHCLVGRQRASRRSRRPPSPPPQRFSSTVVGSASTTTLIRSSARSRICGAPSTSPPRRVSTYLLFTCWLLPSLLLYSLSCSLIHSFTHLLTRLGEHRARHSESRAPAEFGRGALLPAALHRQQPAP